MALAADLPEKWTGKGELWQEKKQALLLKQSPSHPL
jgi:hypothetical protein